MAKERAPPWRGSAARSPARLPCGTQADGPEGPVMHAPIGSRLNAHKHAERRRCVPYLSPGSVTHREQKRPVSRRSDAQRLGAGDDFGPSGSSSLVAGRGTGPGRCEALVRRSSCRRSGCTTSRCRWMGSAPVRGKAWRLRLGMRESGRGKIDALQLTRADAVRHDDHGVPPRCRLTHPIGLPGRHPGDQLEAAFAPRPRPGANAV
jgi:hypothetical protein